MDFAEWRKEIALRTGVLTWQYGVDPGDRLLGDDAAWGAKNLRKRRRFWPATLIDVGVGAGTPGLYEAFPDAHLVLIEPLEEFKPDLERLVQEHGGEYVLTGVGREAGSVALHIDQRVLEMSTALKVTGPKPWADEARELRSISMTTLDALLDEKGWQPPYGLKIDTEGYEYEVVLGATQLLQETEFVIAELSVMQRYEDSYRFADFIALMESRGFHMCDVLDGRKVLYRDVIYLDVMFQRGPPVAG
jgi:FkbM family methyltransferase